MVKHELNIGESVELEPEFSHLDVAPAAVHWGTSNASVISVEETNRAGVVKVTGVSAGAATVTLNAGVGYDAEEDFVVHADPKSKVSIKFVE